MDESHRWTIIDEVIVSFTVPGRISDALWDTFLDEITARRPKHCLVLCIGPVEVDAVQRRLSTQAVMRTRTSVVVVTDNRVTKGLAMAVAWFGAKLDAYAWTDLERALDRFEIAATTRQQLLEEARRFYGEHGYIDT